VEKETIKNVVDVYSHISFDTPWWVVTYYDENEKKFKTTEVIEGTVEIKDANEEIKRKFEAEVEKVRRRDKELSKKFSKVVHQGICLFCGSKIFPIRRESLRRHLRLNRNRRGYYCPRCKVIWIHEKYPSPCHFSEVLEAIKNKKVVYTLFFDYYMSPIIPRFRESGGVK